MVRKEPWLYLLAGQDSLSKDSRITQIKKALLPAQIESFNLDILHSEGLSLKELQEKLLCLPVRAKKRLLIIRQAESLKEELREFLLEYAKDPPQHLVLVLDSEQFNPKDDFLLRIARLAQVFRFKENIPVNTFTLIRQIEAKRADSALKLLHQLLKEGEKPERILGGLRHALLRNAGGVRRVKAVSRLLLDCDLALKTSRVRPDFALEKAVVELCCF